MKNDCEHILKQAALAHEEGRFADAEKAYLEILSEKPESASVLNALGTVLLDQGQPDKAKTYFEKAVRGIINCGRKKPTALTYRVSVSLGFRGVLSGFPVYFRLFPVTAAAWIEGNLSSQSVIAIYL
jgi:tetratricopeptide (TPR) repeat protein